MAGETLQFSTSAIRAYTGPTGGSGKPQRGTGGTAGVTGSRGLQGPDGPRGSTGIMLKRTEWDEETKRWNIIFAPYGDETHVVVVGPTGLTGNSGYVSGATPSFYNIGGNFAVVTGGTWGTVVGPGTDPYWTGGISGSTLSFRKLGVSGDLVFYTDQSNRIGTGPTYDIIGISGPNAMVQYGTVTGQSVGELLYLTDKVNVKDAHGLTFNEDMTLAASGFSAGGFTWGTIQTKLYNATNHYHIHGNAVQGITDPNFVINNNQSSVHVLYTPFTLQGITYEKHAEKKPISVTSPWLAEESGVYGISGATANYGEATTATLIIKNGPMGANFSNNFFFPQDSNQLGEGTSIINCLSYDEGVSWLCSVVGTNFGYEGTISDPESLGSCCDSTVDSPSFGDCREFVTDDECSELGESYTWYNASSCDETPCSEIVTEIGSCCINKTEDGEAICLDTGDLNKEECETFGGTWRANVPCGPAFPCGDPCDEDFGQVGSCCKYDEEGRYLECEDDVTELQCSVYGSGDDEEGHYSIYGGDNSYCSSTNCCDFVEETGACCLGPGVCSDSITARACSAIGGIYQGHGTSCSNVICVCEPPDGGGGPGDPGDCLDPNAIGICCFGCNPVGCSSNCTCQQCLDSGGEFLGAGSCSDNPCQDVPPPGGGVDDDDPIIAEWPDDPTVTPGGGGDPDDAYSCGE